MQERSSNGGDLQEAHQLLVGRSRTSVLPVSERPSKADVSQERHPSMLSRARTTLQDVGSGRSSLLPVSPGSKRGTKVNPMPSEKASEKSKMKKKSTLKVVEAAVSSQERRASSSKMRTAFSHTRSALADIRGQGGKATFAGVASAFAGSLQKLNNGWRFCGAIQVAAAERQEEAAEDAEDDEIHVPPEETTEKQVFLDQVQELLLKDEESTEWLEHLASIVKPLNEGFRNQRKLSVWHAKFLTDLGHDMRPIDENFEGMISELNETLTTIEKSKKSLTGQLEELECLQMDSREDSADSSSSDSSLSADEASKPVIRKTSKIVTAPMPTLPSQESFQDSIISALNAHTGEDASAPSICKLGGLSSSNTESRRVSNRSSSGHQLTTSVPVGSSSSDNMHAARRKSLHVAPALMQLGVAQIGLGMSLPSKRRTSTAEMMGRRASRGGICLNPMVLKKSRSSASSSGRGTFGSASRAVEAPLHASEAPVEELRSAGQVKAHVLKMRRVAKSLKKAQHNLAALIGKAVEDDMGTMSKDSEGRDSPPLQDEPRRNSAAPLDAVRAKLSRLSTGDELDFWVAGAAPLDALRAKLARLSTGSNFDNMISGAVSKLPEELRSAAEEGEEWDEEDAHPPLQGRPPSQNARRTSLQGDRRTSGVPSSPLRRSSKRASSQKSQDLGGLLEVTLAKLTKTPDRFPSLNSLDAPAGTDNQESSHPRTVSEDSQDSNPRPPRRASTNLQDLSTWLQSSASVIPEVSQESLPGLDEDLLGTPTTNLEAASDLEGKQASSSEGSLRNEKPIGLMARVWMMAGQDEQSSPADFELAEAGQVGLGSGSDHLDEQETQNSRSGTMAALMGRRSLSKPVTRMRFNSEEDQSLLDQNIKATVTCAPDHHTTRLSIAIDRDESQQSSEEQSPKGTNVSMDRKTFVFGRKTMGFSHLGGWSKTLTHSLSGVLEQELDESEEEEEKEMPEGSASHMSVQEEQDWDRALVEDDKRSTHSRPGSDQGPRQLQQPIFYSSAEKERARLAGRRIVEEHKMQDLLLQELSSQWRPRLTTTKPAPLFEVPWRPPTRGDPPRLQTPRRAKDRDTFKETAARSTFMKLHLRPAKHMRVDIIAEDNNFVEKLYRNAGASQRSATGGVHTAHTLRTACFQPGRSGLQRKPPSRGLMEVHLWGWEREDLCGGASCRVPEVPEVRMKSCFQSIDDLDVDFSEMDLYRD